MIIRIYNKQSSLKICARQVRKIIKAVIEEEGQSCEEVSVYFVDTPAICQLHEQFFQDPSPTDCLSLPMDQEEESPYRLLGEVFVCPATALEYAAQHGLDPYQETTLYIVHGLLHLMGYDDLTAKERKKMRGAEARHLANLHKVGFSLSINRHLL